jgi:preflagellin peptidase FlaK
MREVSNRVWVVFAPLALALTSLQYFLFAPQSWFIYALSFGATSALSIVLFYAGAFGGADAKALICLSLALPTYPVYFLQPFFSYVVPLFPITVFCNAVLLAALSVFYAITRNYLWKGRTGKRFFEGFEKESRWRKVLTVLCGYKVEAAELEKGGYLYPLEDVHVGEAGEMERKLIVMPKDEKREEVIERILNAARRGKLPKEVWVTPGLPFLIFVTAGFIVALIFGDIVWVILRSALGQGI